MYNIKFVKCENIENDIFIVMCDDVVLKLKLGKLLMNALGDKNKLTVKNFAYDSDLNLCYHLKTYLPSLLERFL